MKILIIQHTREEHAGVFTSFFSEMGWPTEIRCAENRDPMPAALQGYQGMMILGGPMGAYEEEKYPYLRQVQQLIREAAALRLPSLGICLGGQLMARALGAQIAPSPVKEIGWYRLRLTKRGSGSDLFRGFPAEFSGFQWHQDSFELPAGAHLLVKGEGCFNQGFVYNGHLWGLQYHPEMTPDMVQEWLFAHQEEATQFGGPDAHRQIMDQTRTVWIDEQATRKRFLLNLRRVFSTPQTD